MGIEGIGNAKALSLYRRVKKEITCKEQVPTWISEVIKAVEDLPIEAPSILQKDSSS